MKKQILLCTLVGLLGIFLPIFILGLIQFLLLVMLGVSISQSSLGYISIFLIAFGMLAALMAIVETNFFKLNK